MASYFSTIIEHLLERNQSRIMDSILSVIAWGLQTHEEASFVKQMIGHNGNWKK